MARSRLRIAVPGYLALLLLALAAVHVAMGSPIDSIVSHHSRAIYLHKSWADLFGLTDNSTVAPSQISLPYKDLPNPDPNAAKKAALLTKTLIPWPPHLEHCAEKTRRRLASEQRGADGELPGWAREGGRGDGSEAGMEGGAASGPPWVVGSDDDNLPLTRRVQRDIWRHQMAADCSDPSTRFLLVAWRHHRGYGLGAQLHIMSAALSLAVASNRVLVPEPKSFLRADHEGCHGSHRSSLDCYFFPIASPLCSEKAAAAHEEAPLPEWAQHKPVRELLNSNLVVVHIGSRHVWTAFKFEASAAIKWGSPWANSSAPFRYFGESTKKYDPKMAQVNWWRSQAVRFMLRWPSPYLCHLTNAARHKSYGLRVALFVARAEAGEKIAREESMRFSAKEANDLGAVDFERILADDMDNEDDGRLMIQSEPFIFRPIVSIHVRQGDKGKEMRLFSFAAFMWLAQRLRLAVPNMRYVWLSTEMQSVIEETPKFQDWTFFFTDVPRQIGSTSFNEYETSAGLVALVGASFVNLMIAAQCDYFVGTLGSNWNRLINELRLTNGRRKSIYLTLNNNEW